MAATRIEVIVPVEHGVLFLYPEGGSPPSDDSAFQRLGPVGLDGTGLTLFFDPDDQEVSVVAVRSPSPLPWRKRDDWTSVVEISVQGGRDTGGLFWQTTTMGVPADLGEAYDWADWYRVRVYSDRFPESSPSQVFMLSAWGEETERDPEVLIG